MAFMVITGIVGNFLAVHLSVAEIKRRPRRNKVGTENGHGEMETGSSNFRSSAASNGSSATGGGN